MEPLRETKICLKNQLVQEIWGKIIVFDSGEGNGLLFEVLGGLRAQEIRILLINKLFVFLGFMLTGRMRQCELLLQCS